MKPYSFALTVFRLAAVSMALYVLYGLIVYTLSMASLTGRDTDFDAVMAFNRAAAWRNALVTLASAAVLYVAAPKLAWLVALSKET